MKDLKIIKQVDGICNHCGEDIEENYYFNDKGEPVHVTTVTNGYYYDDGTVLCGGCN